MARALALLVASGCGRIAFAPLDDAAVRSPDGSGATDGSVDPSLRLWLAFEDDLDDGAADSSGANAHATCFTSCPDPTTTGRYGNAASFDAMGQSLQAMPIVPGNDFTWTAWVRPASQQAFGAILSMHGEASLRPGGAEIALIGGAMYLYMHDTSTNAGRMVAVDAWQHLAFVRVGTQYVPYVDGVVGANGSESDAHDFANCPLLIGVDADLGCTGSLNGYFDGDIDEVRIYARPLTTAEILADMASATPVPPP